MWGGGVGGAWGGGLDHLERRGLAGRLGKEAGPVSTGVVGAAGPRVARHPGAHAAGTPRQVSSPPLPCPAPPPQGPKAVLGPGTGLGEAVLFWDDHLNNYKVHASGEGGGGGWRCGSSGQGGGQGWRAAAGGWRAAAGCQRGRVSGRRRRGDAGMVGPGGVQRSVWSGSPAAPCTRCLALPVPASRLSRRPAGWALVRCRGRARHLCAARLEAARAAGACGAGAGPLLGGAGETQGEGRGGEGRSGGGRGLGGAGRAGWAAAAPLRLRPRLRL